MEIQVAEGAQARVSTNIKLAARLRGLSIPQLSAACGLGHKQNLYDRLNGDTAFKIQDIFDIAESLHVSVESLVGDPKRFFDQDLSQLQCSPTWAVQPTLFDVADEEHQVDRELAAVA